MFNGRAVAGTAILTICSLVCVGRTTPLRSVPPEEDTLKLREMTLHVIPQAHIDLASWWRYDPETIHVVTKRTLEMAFENLEAFPARGNTAAFTLVRHR